MIHARFPALFILALHHVAAMSFIWKEEEGVAAYMREVWEKRSKN
jgi:hypothetical protein